MAPKLTLMVLTQPSREMFLDRLIRELTPQLNKHHQDVEFLMGSCDFSVSVGENRQRLREAAQGQYSCFVDDDDLLADDYLDQVIPLLDGVDYIGFYLERFDDFVPTLRVKHSLTEGNISHINPILTEKALTVRMSGGFGEDRRWWNALKDSGIIQTEHFVDKTMYYYYYRSGKTDGVPKVAGEQHDG